VPSQARPEVTTKLPPLPNCECFAIGVVESRDKREKNFHGSYASSF
jgi:hypothetical protein